MSVPLLDISRQYDKIKNELNRAVTDVLAHGKFILGPEVKELESKVAHMSGVAHGIGVASGTDALLLALRAVGVGAGDEVITTTFSFFATAGVISRLGATPVFVDIEPDSYNIDPTKIEDAITPKTKAIVPVHLYGQIADMDAINEIAHRHNLKVVEDAAQAIGAQYKNRPAGSFGDLACYSFYPTKNLGASGDGGMIVTNDDESGELCRMLRVHGAKPKYYHKIIGYNSRLASMQAAVLLVKLPFLNEWSRKRIAHAEKYNSAFADIPEIVIPTVKEYTTFHIYNQYTIAVPNRDALMSVLREKEIGFEIYYPVPFHRQECFAKLGYKPEQFPICEKISSEVISLPIYPEMTVEEQQKVIEAVRTAVG